MVFAAPPVAVPFVVASGNLAFHELPCHPLNTGCIAAKHLC